MDDSLPDAPPFTCTISTRVSHRVATVTARDDLIVWVRRGSKTLIQAGGQVVCAAGQLCLMPWGGQWDIVNDPDPAGVYEAQVLLPGQAALRTFESLYGAGLPDGAPPVLDVDLDLQQALDRALAALAHQSDRVAGHRLLEVLLLLGERGYRLKPRASLHWDDRVRRLIALRPQADWTLASLAAAFHLSPSSLSRRLAARHTSAGEILRDVRLETGLMLLQTGPLSIGEIALHCGYESHSRFSAAFRRRFGFAPSHLRAAPAVNQSGPWPDAPYAESVTGQADDRPR